MALTIEIKDATKTIEISNSGDLVWDENTQFLDLYAQLNTWHAAVPLASCVWEQAAPVNGMDVFKLTATAKDGRMWKVKVGLRPGIEAPMFSFDVGDYFEESEFEPQRTMRLNLVYLVRKHGITKLEVTWA